MHNCDIDEGHKQREIEGEAKYGPIKPLNDPRCFLDEARDELLDFLNCWEWSMQKGEISFCEWTEIDELGRMALLGLKEAKI